MQKILLTGGNRGIGKAIATNLIEEGHHVVIVSRNEEEGKKIVLGVKEKNKNAHISSIQGDLSNITTCYQLITQIKQQHPDISVLINNAGVWMTEKQLNEDGLEISFMVNYLAPFILSTELREVLQKNTPSRIVNVNAGLYVKGTFDPKRTPYGLDFSPIKTYANSKLCGAMFVIDFANQLDGNNITLNAVHPGVIRTDLGDSNKLISKLIGMIKVFWKSPEYGAKAPVWLAISNEIVGVNGKYFNEKKRDRIFKTS